MEPVLVQFKLLTLDAKPFAYSRANDACMDIYSNENITFHPGETRIVPTGVAIAIPEGYEGLIRGRSGLSSRGIHVEHGTIDCEYRGEIGVIIHNATPEFFNIHKGDRIAQFTLKEVIPVEVDIVKELSSTDRGVQGFGSSGV